MKPDLKTYLTLARERIDTELEACLGTATGQSRITEAMRYSLMAGGKRLRPILCMAAAETLGGNRDNVMPAACALEMVHTYSLIHDDLPAMDDDALRRGKATSHIRFDEATAVLAGDALLTLAFRILSASEYIKEKNAVLWLRVIRSLSEAAGHRGMIEGQMRDMAGENAALPLDELEKTHRLKTGAMIEASVICGAVLADGTDGDVSALKTYAGHIGLAFQVTDDILNVSGDPAVMGKAAGTDKTRNKSTYPSIMGLGASEKFARKLVNDALTALDSFDAKADPLRNIAKYILQRKR